MAAYKKGKPQEVVLFYAVPSTEDAEPANRVFAFDACSPSPVVQTLWQHLKDVAEDGGAAKVAAFINDKTEELAQASRTRWISGKGDQVDVYVFHYEGAQFKIELNEVARKSRFESDLAVLTQLASKIGAARPPGIAHTERSYWLLKPRANLKVAVSAQAPKGKDGQGVGGNGNSSTLADDDGSTGPAKLETTLVTGTSEHFFLSANAGLTNARQVTFDEKTQSFDLAKKPQGFFIGVNYAVGDLVTESSGDDVSNFLRGIYIGAMIEGSKQPFNQLAAVIGFRHNLPGVGKLLSFETVSPYIGILFARDDKPTQDADNGNVTSAYGKGHFVFGLSLNLDKALGWVGGGGDSGGGESTK